MSRPRNKVLRWCDSGVPLVSKKPLIPTLPKDVTQDLETNLDMIQSVLRLARNDAGHPTAAAPEREQVYVYLQLFVPFARQLMRLRNTLK
jgi:hypothetical protein